LVKTEQLISAIQKIIFTFEDASSVTGKITTQDIADRSKSSYTTINEIKNGKLKHLSVKKALEISSNLGGPKDLTELMALTDEAEAVAEAREFARKFPHLYPYEMQSQDQEQFMNDREYSRIIWAAFGNGNITREEIRYRWGQDGIDRLEIILASGLLIEEDQVIKGGSWAAGFSLDCTYKQLKHGVDLYRPLNREKGENWVSFQTQSCNDDFISWFRGRIQSLFVEFNEKSNSFQYQGNKRMFFGMVFDRYMSDLAENEGRLQ